MTENQIYFFEVEIFQYMKNFSEFSICNVKTNNICLIEQKKIWKK